MGNPQIKVIKGKEKTRFLEIRNKLWEIRNERMNLEREMDGMGLEFDLVGRPANFELGD